MALLIFLLGFAFAVALLGHVGLFQAAYGPLERGRRRGAWDPDATPGEMLAFRENGIGVNPQVAYLYAGYDLAPGEALVIEGSVDTTASYASITLYDRLLQGFPGTSGPTHYNHLDLGGPGPWRVVLACEDRGFARFMDVAPHPRGVVAWRHDPIGTAGAPRLLRMTLDEAAARFASGPPAPVPARAGALARFAAVIRNGVRSLSSGDYVVAFAAMQDAADVEAFERLGARLDLDPSGRAVLREREAPTFDIRREWPPGSLGAGLVAHFSGAATFDVVIPPSEFPLTRRAGRARDRWRGTHDLRHVLLGVGTTLPEEAVVHGFQFGQNPNITSALVVTVGAWMGWRTRAPWLTLLYAFRARQAGARARLVVAVPFEDRLEEPIADLAAEFGIERQEYAALRAKPKGNPG